MSTSLPADELVRAPLPLDPDFEALYRDHYGFVWRCARRMCVDEAELEDVIQDVFVIAYRRLAQLDPAIRPSTWLFGILRNVLRNRARGRERHRRRVEAFAAHVEVLDQQRQRLGGERALAGRLLAEFLRELDDDQRAVFVLAELEGYTGREIAEALAINPNTAHSRLRLARRAFCAHFGLEPSRRAVASATRELRERPEQPPAGARARSWGLVVAAVTKSAAWTSGTAGGLLALLSGKLGVALAGVGVAVAAVGLVVGLGGAGQEGIDDESKAHASEAPLARAFVLDHATLELEPAAGGEPPAPRAEPAPRPSAPLIVELPRRPEPARAPPPTPSDAAEQLRRARAALIDGRPSDALTQLEQIPDADPRLLEQRAATEVAAHCKLGEHEAARAVVDRLRARAADSPMLARIDGACW